MIYLLLPLVCKQPLAYLAIESLELLLARRLYGPRLACGKRRRGEEGRGRREYLQAEAGEVESVRVEVEQGLARGFRAERVSVHSNESAVIVPPYLASLTLRSSSRKASSVALAVSWSTDSLCRWSNSAFCICRDTSLLTSGVFAPSARGAAVLGPPQLTSLNCCLCFAGLSSGSSSSSSGLCAIDGEPSPVTECFFAGVPLPSLLTEPFACLRVMPPRILRISSTTCTPSAGFGFFARM